MIRLWFEAEFLIPFLVTENGADADFREGDLSMCAFRSSPFQYSMTRFVQQCDQLSPRQYNETGNCQGLSGMPSDYGRYHINHSTSWSWRWVLTENRTYPMQDLIGMNLLYA